MSQLGCACRRTAAYRPLVISTVLLVLLVFVQCPAFSQISATLSGTVTDPSGALVSNASVTLRNEASGDIRAVTANTEGFFNFQAVHPGTYTLHVEARGFKGWEHPGIVLDAGDQRSVPQIVMQVGSPSEAITVTANESNVALDNAAVGTVLSSSDLERLSTVGRDATELLKIIPGSTIQTGLGNQPYYTGVQNGIGNSGVGSFVINGTQPYGGVAEMADGGNVTDTGCMCANTQSLNTDMLSEVNIQTSSFGSDSPTGPVVINAIGKSGTQSFHGEGYFYARNSALNANSYANDQTGQPVTPAHYYYPGGNIGGPVLIPGAHKWNSEKQLLFWTGFEDYQQQAAGNSGVPLESYVPSAGMRTGDFSASSIAALCPTGYASSEQYCSQPMLNGVPFPNNQIPASMIDPGAAALMKFIPAANASATSLGGFDYIKPYFETYNGWQYHFRADYSINDKNKVFVSFNQQQETDTTHVNEYWVGGNMVEYPSPLDGNSDSHTVTVNYTTILSPTLTNEAIGEYVYFNTPSSFANPNLVDRSAYGWPSSYYGIYNNGVQQMPGINNFGAGSGMGFMPMEGMGPGGKVALKKESPNFQDNLSWVKGTHTMKFGVFIEHSFNAGTNAGVATNGEYSFGNTGTWNYNGISSFAGTGNSVANALLGLTTGYEQANFAGYVSTGYRTNSFYGQDSWKVTKRLTINYGIRFEHIGPWTDDRGIGAAIFDPRQYNPNAPAGTFTGLLWHAIDPSIPVSGVYNYPAFYAEPRGGLAYDIFGTGKTVIRGGWGMYRFQDPPLAGGALSEGIGQVTANTSPGDMTMAQIQSYHPTVSGLVTSGSLGNITVVSPDDNQRPETIDYSFTVDQRIPGNSLLEVSYIGNRSIHLNNDQFNGVSIANINLVPIGAFYNPDPITGAAPNPTNPNANDYRPYAAYQSIAEIKNIEWSKYNSLQIRWSKQRGRTTYNLNYTWSKVIGINTGADPFHVNNDYGLMAYDRPQVFNASYTFSLGSPLHSNWLFNGAVNGWTLSGITTLQSGEPMQANAGSSFGLSCQNCPNTAPLSNSYYLGTSDLTLQPTISCNPGTHLSSNQYISGSCFGVPSVGVNGPVQMPYSAWTPAFFDTDLAIYKDFKVREGQAVQFRFDAFNFLNHPLNSFTSSTNTSLQFTLNNGAYTQTNDVFGFSNTKANNRVLELALKYRF